jgi:hypothetical protein
MKQSVYVVAVFLAVGAGCGTQDTANEPASSQSAAALSSGKADLSLAANGTISQTSGPTWTLLRIPAIVNTEIAAS